MLNIVHLEEIHALLLRVPGLIQQMDSRDAAFVDSVKAWLTEAEQMLLGNRLAVAADVAVLRSVLISDRSN